MSQCLSSLSVKKPEQTGIVRLCFLPGACDDNQPGQTEDVRERTWRRCSRSTFPHTTPRVVSFIVGAFVQGEADEYDGRVRDVRRSGCAVVSDRAGVGQGLRLAA